MNQCPGVAGSTLYFLPPFVSQVEFDGHIGDAYIRATECTLTYLLTAGDILSHQIYSGNNGRQFGMQTTAMSSSMGLTVTQQKQLHRLHTHTHTLGTTASVLCSAVVYYVSSLITNIYIVNFNSLSSFKRSIKLVNFSGFTF